MLFNTTIFENITWAKKVQVKMKLLNAQQAQAHDFIMEKTNGYSTHIGDKGSLLSVAKNKELLLQEH